MRYALVLDDAPLVYARALDAVLRDVTPKPAVLLIVPGIRNQGLRQRYDRAVRRIFGKRAVARLLLRYLTGPALTFDRLATRHRVPLVRATGVNDASFRTALTAHGVTAVFSTTAQIYQAETLAIVACYNFHASLLPAHKGLLPLFWSALSGLPAAVTVHAMVPAIDEGPTLFQALLDVAPGASVPTATEALLAAFPALLARALDHVARDLQPVVLTPPPLASYDPVPDDATIARYHRRQP